MRAATGRGFTPPSSKPIGAPFLSRAIGMALALSGSHALAQEAQPPSPEAKPSPPPQGKNSSTQLEKITVHDQELQPASPKFTAPLVDTPMSITILPQSVMLETAAVSLQDALRNVPGITFAAGEGGTPSGDLPYIRGFNSSSNIYVDGMRDIGVQTRDIFDLEQIEVIKGPDSSIAGRSAGGGTINLVSKTAQADDFLEAIGTYGSAGEYRTMLDGNIKLTDEIAARVNVMNMGGGVPGRGSAVRTDKLGAAAAMTFGLQLPVRLTLNYYHFEDKSTPDYGIPVDYLNTGLPLSQTQGVSTQNYYGLVDRDFRRAPVDSGEARIDYDINDAFTLRSQLRDTVSQNDYVLTLPYLATSAATGALQPGLVYRLPIANADRTRAIISETDLFGHFDTGPIHHDIDVGFEVSWEKEQLAGGSSYTGYNVVSTAGAQGFNGGDCSSPALLASYDCTSLYNPNPYQPWKGTITQNPANTYFTTRDAAPYAFDTITLTPHWKINAGVRWDNYVTSTNDPSDPAAFASDDLSFTSYQVSLMYKPLSVGTIYLTTSTASIPEDQAFSNAGQDQSFPASPYNPSSTGFRPEITRTIEIGTKWNLFAGRLLLSGDLFEERHTNAAVEIQPDIYAQVGETRVKGVELSANGSITENWSLTAGYSFLNAQLLNGGIYGELGNHLPNTPPNAASLWSTYRVAPAVTVGGGVYYRDKQIGYSGPPDEYIDSYTRFDAMAKWQIDRHVALQVNVQNLFDTTYYSKIFYWYALPAAGRTWLVTADVKL